MKAIFDTNLFVGAAFNRRSASAKLIERVRAGDVTLVWDDATRDETRRILTHIPPIRWEDVADLFAESNRWGGGTHSDAVLFVEDSEDRKFAALALATGATLVSSDSDLLDHRERLPVCTPGEFLSCIDATS